MHGQRISQFDLCKNSGKFISLNGNTTKMKFGNIQRDWLFASGNNMMMLIDMKIGKSFNLVFEHDEETTFEIADFRIDGLNNTNVYIIVKSNSSFDSGVDRFWLKHLVIDMSKTDSPWKILKERQVESSSLEIYSSQNKIFLGRKMEGPLFYGIEIIDIKTFERIAFLPLHDDNYNHMSPIRHMLISSGSNTSHYFSGSPFDSTRSIFWKKTRLYTIDEDNRIMCWDLKPKDPEFHGSLLFTMLENSRKQKITSLCLSDNDNHLFTSSHNMIRQWDAKTGILVRIFESKAKVENITVDNDYIYSSDIEVNSNINRWEIDIGLYNNVRHGLFETVASDSKGFIYTSIDGVVIQINARTGSLTRRISDMGMKLVLLQVSEHDDATYIAVLGMFHKISIWRLNHLDQSLAEVEPCQLREHGNISHLVLMKNILTWNNDDELYQVDITQPLLYKLHPVDKNLACMSVSDRYVFATDPKTLCAIDMVLFLII